MTPRSRLVLSAAAALSLAAPALAGDKRPDEPAAARSSPAFDRIKALAGEWEGSAMGHGEKAMTTRATIRVVSAGSAVMLVTDPGTPHEMVTMFHDDDGALMATHYCAAQNQPRMKAASSAEAGRIAFEFQDGTNLKAHPGRMERLVLTSADADHHVQEWTYQGDGKSSTMRMELQRKR